MNSIILLQSEAYDQLQQNTFAYLKKLLEKDREKPAIEWLDNKEAIKLLSVSSRTLQNWRDNGLLGFSQIGSKIYYSRQDIDLMLQQHHCKPFKAVA
jgi:hypothetical protein